MRTLTDKYLLAGAVLYGAAAVSWLLALAKAELSMVYPLLGASYIIASLLAVFFLHETVTVTRWAGVALVVAGVLLIGRS
jgi:drug/metabolite transporter (DMT)-like permease